MAQLLFHLEPAVKEALHRRARRHGRSMEEEVRQILRQVVQADSPFSASEGLGSCIAALFADLELEQPLSEWRGEEALPALFDS